MLSKLKNLGTPSSMRSLWATLRSLPAGGHLMGALVGRIAPYTGTISPEVLTLEPGYAKVRMNDTRRVRNHLNSVHAIALMNLGEAVTGLAMMVSLPDEARGIITRLGMDYVKKARGPITAECSMTVPDFSARQEHDVTAQLKNEAGELVATAHARWLIGPR
jgi:acyl-coenzyme A thioesterase PaaI-like protein